jgi:hypothetical protein
VGETEGCLAQLQVFVEQGEESGASAELSVEMPAISWLKLALQLHLSRLARALFQCEDCRMPRGGLL